jgi:hypothetical protein
MYDPETLTAMATNNTKEEIKKNKESTLLTKKSSHSPDNKRTISNKNVNNEGKIKGKEEVIEEIKVNNINNNNLTNKAMNTNRSLIKETNKIKPQSNIIVNNSQPVSNRPLITNKKTKNEENNENNDLISFLLKNNNFVVIREKNDWKEICFKLKLTEEEYKLFIREKAKRVNLK